jgi:hypothetical protein
VSEARDEARNEVLGMMAGDGPPLTTVENEAILDRFELAVREDGRAAVGRLKVALMLAEGALDLENNLECGDAPPSGRCHECIGCLNNAALEAVTAALSSLRETK